jgi:hypothetical protein
VTPSRENSVSFSWVYGIDSNRGFLRLKNHDIYRGLLPWCALTD